MSQPTSTRFASPRRWWPNLRQAAVLAVIGGGLAAAGGLSVMQLGLYDVAATKLHNPQVGWVLHNTFIHSIRLRAGRDQSLDLSAPHLARGEAVYVNKCAPCHGGPGAPRADWVTGLTPTPPFLLDSARHWTPAELKLIVRNGVKMSAMPGWKTSLSDSDINDVVAYLEVLPARAPQDYNRPLPDQALPQGPKSK